METLIVKIDTAARATSLKQYLKKLVGVKSVSLEKSPLAEADWVRPGRTATDDELEQLAKEMENDKEEYSVNEVIRFVNEEMSKWQKRKKK